MCHLPHGIHARRAELLDAMHPQVPPGMHRQPREGATHVCDGAQVPDL